MYREVPSTSRLEGYWMDTGWYTYYWIHDDVEKQGPSHISDILYFPANT